MFGFFPWKTFQQWKNHEELHTTFFFFQIQRETILKSSTKACFLAISNKGRKITSSVLVVQRKAITMVSLGHYLSFYNGPVGPLCHDKPQPFSWGFFPSCLWIFSGILWAEGVCALLLSPLADDACLPDELHSFLNYFLFPCIIQGADLFSLEATMTCKLVAGQGETDQVMM